MINLRLKKWIQQFNCTKRLKLPAYDNGEQLVCKENCLSKGHMPENKCHNKGVIFIA